MMSNNTTHLQLVPKGDASPFKAEVPGDVDLVVISARASLMRCKILLTGEDVTYKRVLGEVPGEIITVRAKKLYMHGKTRCIQGDTLPKTRRIDVSAMNLLPLNLRDVGMWNPQSEFNRSLDDITEKYLRPTLDLGPRPAFELEQVIPGGIFEIDDIEDPITDANDLYHAGDEEGALLIIEGLLMADFRCLDAHTHLGNWEFSRWEHNFNALGIDHALRHYFVGTQIGELSLGQNFDGLLPWGFTDNRPFLRNMHGLGLCYWRLGKVEESRTTFQRMLMLNPNDNQGARFCLAALDDGRRWEDAEE